MEARQCRAHLWAVQRSVTGYWNSATCAGMYFASASSNSARYFFTSTRAQAERLASQIGYDLVSKTHRMTNKAWLSVATAFSQNVGVFFALHIMCCLELQVLQKPKFRHNCSKTGPQTSSLSSSSRACQYSLVSICPSERQLRSFNPLLLTPGCKPTKASDAERC